MKFVSLFEGDFAERCDNYKLGFSGKARFNLF